MSRLGTALLIVAAIAGVSGYAIAAGQDINWDSRNYHYDSVSFVAPFLPPSSRHVRLTGDMGIGVPLGRRAVEILGSHAGPMRTLTEGELRPGIPGVLASLGFTVAAEKCEPVPTRAVTLSSCPVVRGR